MVEALKISIIIPVYNCADFLEQCLMSVQNQTCTALEILCIDDGSTDNSVEVIRKLMEKDERIQLFQQTNQGAGKARNLGIQKARGKYLAFLDADDYYLDEDALEKMVALCEEKQVPVCGSFRKKLDNDVEKVEKLLLEVNEKGCTKQILEYVDFQLDYDYQSFIYSRELIQSNNIYFPDYRRFQDPPFMVKALFMARRFTVADTYLYCYRMPTMAARFTVSKVRDLLCGLRDNLQFAYEHGLSMLFERSMERVEYEYESIIYHNLSAEDLDIPGLLFEINAIARNGLRDDTYVIRPLRRIMESAIYAGQQYEEQLLDLVNSQRGIALYGAGRYTKAFVCFLEKHSLQNRVRNIVVSNKTDNPEVFEGVSVITIDEYSSEETYLLVTVGAIYQKEIEGSLQAKGIKKYKLVDDVFLSGL